MLNWFYTKVKENIVDPTNMLDYKSFINEHKSTIVLLITTCVTLITITIINYVRVANYIELVIVTLLVYMGYISLENIVDMMIGKEHKKTIEEK